jgi:putative acyl-CoA dehydrogenase
MSARAPLADLGTHQVQNQVPPLEDYNLFDADPALVEAVRREGAGWAEHELRAFGALMGSERVQRLGFDANRFKPELRIFDRYGRRVDEVEYHPAYHELMRLAVEQGMPSLPWRDPQPGAHVAHSVMLYLLSQVEAGVCCPLTMTYAVVPALRRQPEVAAEWEPKATARSYDPRCIPLVEKAGATFGMAMTEKQGGSDVRTNTTVARAIGAGGLGGEYLLTGHKWFCSAPMSDGFLTLANTARGLSCFLVPRWLPDGTRNRFFVQRLKDKLGNHSNASSEIEYQDTWARMVGEDGRGVRTILDMVHHTRNDTVTAPASFMRQAVIQASHHVAHRSAFGKRLVEQPLMRNVLGDLVVEAEAATVLAMRISRSFDDAATGAEEAQAFCRIATAVAKYWLNKRAPGHVVEALECLGGAGYVEESVFPRLYREAPLNGIWEGSGNVICLDVLRAMAREPGSVEAFLDELERARGGDRRLDAAFDGVRDALRDPADLEQRARRVTERMALALQGALLVRHAPAAVADAFCASRLGGDHGRVYGTLPPGLDLDALVRRGASPA